MIGYIALKLLAFSDHCDRFAHVEILWKCLKVFTIWVLINNSSFQSSPVFAFYFSLISVGS